MHTSYLNLLLADDDRDDCFFFNEALEELAIPVTLTTVNDGTELMELLSKKDLILPDVLFLDLNMPCKSGIDCLSEIKAIKQLSHLPVIIFSTSLNMDVVEMLYEKGANYYIRKPGEFKKLKQMIFDAILLSTQNKSIPTSRDKFIL